MLDQTLLTVVLVLGLSSVGQPTITAFDCDSPETSIFKLDLTEPAACRTQASHYASPKDVLVEVIQTDLQRSVEVCQCEAFLTQTVFRCGLDSISYGSHTALLRQPVEISVPACRNALLLGSLMLSGRAFVVEANREHTVEFFTHGSLDSDNHCSVETFTPASSFRGGATQSGGQPTSGPPIQHRPNNIRIAHPDHPVRRPTDIRTADSTSAEQHPDRTHRITDSRRPTNIRTADSTSAEQHPDRTPGSPTQCRPTNTRMCQPNGSPTQCRPTDTRIARSGPPNPAANQHPYRRFNIGRTIARYNQHPDRTSGLSLIQHRPNNRAMSTNRHPNCHPVRQHRPNSRRRDQQADQLNSCTPRLTSGQLPPDPTSADVPRLTSDQTPTPHTTTVTRRLSQQ